MAEITFSNTHMSACINIYLDRHMNVLVYLCTFVNVHVSVCMFVIVCVCGCAGVWVWELHMCNI